MTGGSRTPRCRFVEEAGVVFVGESEASNPVTMIALPCRAIMRRPASRATD